MSQSEVYVQAVDGLLYKDPVPHGPDWFVCFCDDEPPELVLGRNRGDTLTGLSRLATMALVSAGIQYDKLRKHDVRSARSFPPTGKAKDAAAFYFRLLAPIPVPRSYGGVKIAPAKLDCPCWIFWHDFDTRVVLESLLGISVDALLAEALLKREFYLYAGAKEIQVQLSTIVHKLYPWTRGITAGNLEARLPGLPGQLRIEWRRD